MPISAQTLQCLSVQLRWSSKSIHWPYMCPWLPTSPLTLPTLLPHSTHSHHTTLVTLASTLFLEFTTLLLHKGFFTVSFLCQVHSLSTEPYSSFYYCLYFFAYIQLYRKSILLAPYYWSPYFAFSCFTVLLCTWCSRYLCVPLLCLS